MCVLARNVMHQYIFLILWWALAVMIVVNVFNVIAGLINVFFRQVTSAANTILLHGHSVENIPHILSFYILNYSN